MALMRSPVRSRSGPPSFAHECRRRMPRRSLFLILIAPTSAWHAFAAWIVRSRSRWPLEHWSSSAAWPTTQTCLLRGLRGWLPRNLAFVRVLHRQCTGRLVAASTFCRPWASTEASAFDGRPTWRRDRSAMYRRRRRGLPRRSGGPSSRRRRWASRSRSTSARRST